jgi:hypothetical protein
MSPAGFGTKDDFAGEDQQQFTRPYPRFICTIDPTSLYVTKLSDLSWDLASDLTLRIKELNKNYLVGDGTRKFGTRSAAARHKTRF